MRKINFDFSKLPKIKGLENCPSFILVRRPKWHESAMKMAKVLIEQSTGEHITQIEINVIKTEFKITFKRLRPLVLPFSIELLNES